MLLGTTSVPVPEDSPLEEIIAGFAHAPEVPGVFLVDSHQRFVGLITDVNLMKWVQVKLFGGGKSRTASSAWEIFRLVSATKAGDLVREGGRSLGVRESDTLQDALEQMIEHGTSIIPVLDDEGRVLGDLRLSEVILKVLQVGKGP